MSDTESQMTEEKPDSAAEVTVESLFVTALSQVSEARKDLKNQGITDLRRAAASVDACHTALKTSDVSVQEEFQTKLIGLLDEVEQLTKDLLEQDKNLRADMKALNNATSAQRAYKSPST